MMTSVEYAEIIETVVDRIKYLKYLRDTLTEEDRTYRARIEECGYLLLVFSKKFKEILEREVI